MVLAELGNSLASIDRQQEGLARFDEGINILSLLYGDEHPNLANLWLFKAHLLIDMEHLGAAEIAVNNSERIARQAMGPDSDLVNFVLEGRARLMLKRSAATQIVDTRTFTECKKLSHCRKD